MGYSYPGASCSRLTLLSRPQVHTKQSTDARFGPLNQSSTLSPSTKRPWGAVDGESSPHDLPSQRAVFVTTTTHQAYLPAFADQGCPHIRHGQAAMFFDKDDGLGDIRAILKEEMGKHHAEHINKMTAGNCCRERFRVPRPCYHWCIRLHKRGHLQHRPKCKLLVPR